MSALWGLPWAREPLRCSSTKADEGVWQRPRSSGAFPPSFLCCKLLEGLEAATRPELIVTADDGRLGDTN